MHGTLRIFPALLLLLLGGCTLFGGFEAGEVDLGMARQLWARQGSERYLYTVSRDCFCPYPGRFTVLVDRGSVTSAVSVDMGEAVPEEELRVFSTIEELFDLIAQAIREADFWEASYNPDLGYPTLIVVDYDEKAVDDEFRYTITELRRFLNER